MSELDVPPSTAYYFGMGLLTDNIKALRLRFRTQTDFADALGVSQPTIARWMKGAVPEHDKLAELARLAGVPVEVFSTVPFALFGGMRVSPVPSVGELAQILTVIVQGLPPSLPYSEWPRVVAEELHTRLSTLLSDRAIQIAQDLQAVQESGEDDRSRPPRS